MGENALCNVYRSLILWICWTSTVLDWAVSQISSRCTSFSSVLVRVANIEDHHSGD